MIICPEKSCHIKNASGQKQAALDSLAEALAVGEQNAGILLMCAKICNDIAEYDAAIEYAKAVQKIDPGNFAAYYIEGWAFQHLGPGKAYECHVAFQKALDTDDEESNLLYALKGRAGARRLLGKEVEARADYTEVLNRIKTASDHWLEGWIKYNLEQYDAAAEALQLAIDEDEDRISARFDLALCHAVAGNAEAFDLYKATLVYLDTQEPQARLAPLRVAQNDLRTAEFVHEELSKDPRFCNIMAEVEASLKQTEALVVRPILPEIPEIRARE